jgi:hypothetical protein
VTSRSAKRWPRAVATACAGLALVAVSFSARGAPEGATAVHPVPFAYDIYTFRGERGRTQVVTSVAVQARRLRREDTDGWAQYRFDVRFALADTVRLWTVSTIDSVFVRTPAPLPDDHLLHTFVETVADPAPSFVHRVVVTDAARGGAGQLYQTPFEVPDYSGSALMLSDIALGLPGSEGGWRRRGVTLGLLPASLFPASSFDVYYEIYNLPAGSRYDTEVAIEPLDRDEGEVVRTVFSEESAAGSPSTVPVLRHVQSALPEGRYRLTVTVTTRGGRSVATQDREIEVQGWNAGATMVPALPKTGGG